MAIKLADVLNNVNSAYPVINAHENTVVGLYNGVAADAVQPLKIYWSSAVKSLLSSDGTANSIIRPASLPYSNQPAGGIVAASDTDYILTEKGGLLVVEDEKLNSGMGAYALYLTQTVFPGSSYDAGRGYMSRFTELIQDFDMYESISASDLAEINQSGTDNFYFAGYDTANSKTRRVDSSSLIALITNELTGEMISGGMISSSTGTGGTGGLEGDFNGDGQISTADLLQFLSSFGSTGYGWDRTVMSGASDSVDNIQIAAFPSTTSGTNGTFTTADLTTFNYPATYSLDGVTSGFDTESYSTSSANTYTLSDANQTDTNLAYAWAYRYLHVDVYTDVFFNTYDTLYGMLYVKVTDTQGNYKECIYYMSGFNQVGSNGVSSTLSGGGGIVIGVTEQVTWSADMRPAWATTINTAADLFQDYSSDLASGWSMDIGNTANFGFLLDSVEVKVFFTCLNGEATVDVNSVNVKIIP